MRDKIKIGILISDPMILSWELSFIEEINRSQYSRIALIIYDIAEETCKKQSERKATCFFRIHHKLDRLIFLNRACYENKYELSKSANDVPCIKLKSAICNHVKFFNNDDLNKIRDYKLDILIKLNYGMIGGEILNVPAYGVWSYSSKLCPSVKEDTTGYYEVVRKMPVTCSYLIVLKDKKEKNMVLAMATESTCAYSISLNKNKLFRRAALFIPRVVFGLYREGGIFLDRLEQRYNKLKCETICKVPVPSSINALVNIGKAAAIAFQKIVKKIMFTDPFSWVLLYRIGYEQDFADNNYGNFKSLKPSKDKFWADPFVIIRNERYYIFVEEFIYKKNKGHISVLEIDRGGSLISTRKIIDRPYHMSYPFVFEVDDDFYMIPESAGNKTIDLYKCIDFPDKWVFAKTIMNNINAVDTTLFHYNHKWWLFTVIDKLDDPKESSPELFLFYNNDFTSDNWISHPLNPIVTDVRTARPAGKIFMRDDKIYRPSQDCAGNYGNSFNINRIIKLSETDYEEESVVKVKPDWNKNLKGTHTFNFNEDFTIIDAYSIRRRFF